MQHLDNIIKAVVLNVVGKITLPPNVSREDVMQEMYLRIYANIDKLNTNDYDIKQQVSYLKQIAYNTYVTYMKYHSKVVKKANDSSYVEIDRTNTDSEKSYVIHTEYQIQKDKDDDPIKSLLDLTEEDDYIEYVDILLEDLTQKEYSIIEQLYLVDEPMSVTELAEEMKVSRQLIYSTRDRVFAKLVQKAKSYEMRKLAKSLNLQYNFD